MRAGQVIAFTGATFLAAMLGLTGYLTLGRQTSACLGGAVMGAKIGGALALHDSQGRAVTEKDVLAGASLVYFGYANCPDVCPVDNARNDTAADLMAAQGYQLTPVFISVDPTRDTPEVLGEYEAAFSHLRTYSGTEAEIAAAAKAWLVYYEVPPADLEAYKSGALKFYTVNHTTMTYLTKPGGEVVAVFQRENSAEEIAKWAPCYLGSA